jgi:hypothetical protein
MEARCNLGSACACTDASKPRSKITVRTRTIAIDLAIPIKAVSPDNLVLPRKLLTLTAAVFAVHLLEVGALAIILIGEDLAGNTRQNRQREKSRRDRFHDRFSYGRWS